MSGFPWLPLGYEIRPGTKSGRLLSGGNGYQILIDSAGGSTILILKVGAIPESAALQHFVAERDAEISIGRDRYVATIYPLDASPVRVIDLATRPDFIESTELMSLTNGLIAHLRCDPHLNWSTSILIVRDGLCIPTEANDDSNERMTTAISVMTSGVLSDPKMSVNQIRGINLWLTTDDIETLLYVLNPESEENPDGPKVAGSASETLEPFYLAGQPRFTQIANEYVVDQVRNREGYQKMGVRMPNAILLHGPKGSGKTFAVKKLANHLKWAFYEVGFGDVGSQYIHQTAKNFKQLFDAASAKGSALIILNEVDALMGRRGPHSHDYRIEEVNELLRLIESAAERGILVIGTTNRRDGLDDAFLRKGRFDLQVEMNYPGATQVREILETLVSARPHLPNLNYDPLIKQLTGRPVSDIEWVANEAARIAVKGGKSTIDDICLFSAISGLKKEQG